MPGPEGDVKSEGKCFKEEVASPQFLTYSSVSPQVLANHEMLMYL